MLRIIFCMGTPIEVTDAAPRVLIRGTDLAPDKFLAETGVYQPTDGGAVIRILDVEYRMVGLHHELSAQYEKDIYIFERTK